ncbi:(2Fe-2S)-binding protein [Streptomyces sp. 900105755]|uniref:(2Fe-2S)-binding protein n=1 Tax=unclassified Streptomyces TaxID=2593676 RepID=UPI00089CDB2D|nr:(2Fe-2S)-binding protein [Streptomyces sp. Ag109_O5-10]SEF10103.1 Bacterioferritin-associated ferredoxin [Streptomyces sp. Ag109_O5-10]
MYVCSCFGVTESQVKQHAEDGACTPRQIASACKAGTDCGSCVRRIQAILGRGACPRREPADEGRLVLAALAGERPEGARGTARSAATDPRTAGDPPRPFPRSA